MKYTVIQTYETAVDLEVDADSEEEAVTKAEELIAGGAVTDRQILDGLEPIDLYVLDHEAD